MAWQVQKTRVRYAVVHTGPSECCVFVGANRGIEMIAYKEGTELPLSPATIRAVNSYWRKEWLTPAWAGQQRLGTKTSYARKSYCDGLAMRLNEAEVRS